jgi:hypothetical protein
MKTIKRITWLLTLGISLSPHHRSFAQLPALNEKPWLGYFAGYEDRRFKFGVTSRGEIKLTPLNNKGFDFGPHMALPVLIGIEEIQPDGKTDLKPIRVDTLKSEQSPTDKIERVVLQAKVSADASFEAVIEQKSGVISIGGRMLDKGQFKKNPVRFAVRVRIPNNYPWTTEERWKSDPKKVEPFLKKIANDSIELNRTDKKRITWTFEKPVDAASGDLSGPGVSRIEMRMQSFGDRKFLFNASENSVMTISNTPNTPLYQGFILTWIPDPEKDKDGKARLGLTVK